MITNYESLESHKHKKTKGILFHRRLIVIMDDNAIIYRMILDSCLRHSSHQHFLLHHYLYHTTLNYTNI